MWNKFLCWLIGHDWDSRPYWGYVDYCNRCGKHDDAEE